LIFLGYPCIKNTETVTIKNNGVANSIAFKKGITTEGALHIHHAINQQFQVILEIPGPGSKLVYSNEWYNTIKMH
jgi:hypothetical protein